MNEPDDVPMDDRDFAVLDRLAGVFALVDPPPADLDERVLFGVDLADAGFDLEVARLGEDLPATSGARAAQQTRTITFDADVRTIMITAVERADGLLRIDGWLAPGAALRVDLRAPEPAPVRTVTADETGRFVFDRVRHGLAQLVVHPAPGDGPRVITPSLLL
jgi:hypothetical protein